MEVPADPPSVKSGGVFLRGCTRNAVLGPSHVNPISCSINPIQNIPVPSMPLKHLLSIESDSLEQDAFEADRLLIELGRSRLPKMIRLIRCGRMQSDDAPLLHYKANSSS
ncbi:hypothetical protein CEXT_186331 [Caerostris extrusa]|uniref:Uncharacterized protein n=1 Tax=Caerostris extrusa TaxID=172846 RepID=A0AAV4XWC2_CAEEX|nr:hypothetical protein CEXT_186331 [Caerostris extrusa]